MPVEVESVIQKSPKNKAPGVDGLTTEPIQACGPSGIKWLTRLFNTAWEERNVPDYWQQALIVPV
jgi:hypothetical protein